MNDNSNTGTVINSTIKLPPQKMASQATCLSTQILLQFKRKRKAFDIHKKELRSSSERIIITHFTLLQQQFTF